MHLLIWHAVTELKTVKRHISNIGNTPTTKKITDILQGIIPHKRLRKGRHIITAYVRQAIITGEKQKPPLPTAQSPRC
jgi:hypothetical protein